MWKKRRKELQKKLLKEHRRKVRRRIAKRILLTSGGVALASGAAARVLGRRQTSS